MTGRRREYCQACLDAQRRTEKKRDCQICEGRRPELLPENQEAWVLWSLVNTQWRTGMNGPVGLDYTAVFAIADTYAIEQTPALLGKLKALEINVLRKHDKS